jgi:methylaspartate ammonia-lyase
MFELKINDVLLAPGNGGAFYDDQAAIREGASRDGYRYVGEPVTAGFYAIRQPATSMGIGLVLSDGTVAWGDMMSVVYAGAAGRDPLFDIDNVGFIIESVVARRLQGLDAANFAANCASTLEKHDGKRPPLSIEYGVSQALLGAAAHAKRLTRAEILCEELDLPVIARTVPLYCQSGDDRETTVDKMILKSVDVIPHGLTNCFDRFGNSGEVFRDYVKWVANRVSQLGAKDYLPTLHFDTYGWIGLGISLDPKAIASFIASIADDVPGFQLNIECPADYGSTPAQLEGYARIVEEMAKLGSSARIVADEHCNTLDDIRQFAEAKAAHLIQIKMPDVGNILDSAKAVLICKKHGAGAYLGGSASETDISARASVHVAVATQADMMLAKPGYGVDEAVTIMGNEQSRLLTILRSRV